MNLSLKRGDVDDSSVESNDGYNGCNLVLA